MSKSIGRKSGRGETAPSPAEAVADSTDAEERESAVEELDEALDALPDGGDADSDSNSDDESDSNPLARVDVSGETSFESAEFERSEEHTSELQSRQYLVCRLLLEK